MYQNDSFFTLSTGGQAGLLILSFAIAAVLIGIVWRIAHNKHWILRVIFGLIAIYIFEWFSPQIYYIYYVLLLDVPWQVVIGSPPTPQSLLKLLTFSDNANLSFHSRGVFGWLLIAISLLRK